MKYWKIAPGEKGSLWVEQRDADCIALGWSLVGNLRKYSSKKQLRKAFRKFKYPGTPNQLWRFYREVSRDDKIVASSGKFLYGIGTVANDYKYAKELLYKHSKPVRWELTFWEPLNIGELPISENLRKRLNLNRTVLRLQEDEWLDLEETLTKSQNPFRNLLNWEGLCRAPTTEQEVVVLFSKLTMLLRMKLEYVGTRFPDAIVRVKSGRKWISKAAEIEVFSSNFSEHGHLEDMVRKEIDCDYIICWKHDLAEKPKDLRSLKIIELREILEEVV